MSIEIGKIASILLSFIHHLFLTLSKLIRGPGCTNFIVLDPQLVDLSNNQTPPPTISLFSVMFSDNTKLCDNLVEQALGPGVRGASYLC